MRIGSMAPQDYPAYEPEFNPSSASEESQAINNPLASSDSDRDNASEIQGAKGSKLIEPADNDKDTTNECETNLENKADKLGGTEKNPEHLLDRLNAKDKVRASELANDLKKFSEEEQKKLLSDALKDKSLSPEMREYLQALLDKILRGEDISDLLAASTNNETPRNDAPGAGASDNQNSGTSPDSGTPFGGAAGGGRSPGSNASQPRGPGAGASQTGSPQTEGGQAQGTPNPSGAPQSIERGTLKPGKGVAEGLMVDSRLEATLEKIGESPEGKKLIEAAKAKGLKEVGVSNNLGPGIGGVFQGSSIAIADPNGPNVTSILAHELGHAAADSSHNSKNEELAVTKVGNRVARDVTNGADNGIPINVEQGVYANLPRDNGIIDTLARVGIRV